jgi:hypothetical protein
VFRIAAGVALAEAAQVRCVLMRCEDSPRTRRQFAHAESVNLAGGGEVVEYAERRRAVRGGHGLRDGSRFERLANVARSFDEG